MLNMKITRLFPAFGNTIRTLGKCLEVTMSISHHKDSVGTADLDAGRTSRFPLE